MPETFTLETRAGFRRVEFDPDVFRFRDVRILVDGDLAATMPFPKARSPYQEATFELDGHELIGIAYLTSEPSPSDAIGVQLDLFANGRSLSDGTDITDARSGAARPGKAYPAAFQVVDAVLRIKPAAGAPGFAVGVGRGVADIGWAWALILLAFVVGLFGLGAMVAARAWHRIREEHSWSVAARTGIGLAAIIGPYAIGSTVLLLTILAVRPRP